MPEKGVRAGPAGAPLRRVLVDLEVFSPTTAIQGEVSLEVAVGILEGHLRNPAVDREQLVKEICDMKNLFLFLYSTMSAEGAEAFIGFLCETIPSDAVGYKDSLFRRLLDELSLFFWNRQSACPKDRYKSVQLTQAALNALYAFSFPAEDITPIESIRDIAAKRTSQREVKKRRAAHSSRTATIVDPKVFQALKLEIPTTALEASILTTSLLQSLREVLLEYLKALRSPALVEDIRNAYFASPDCAQSESIHDAPSASHTPELDVVPSVKSHHSDIGAHPRIQPLKAALYFNSAEGFGDWRIHITSKADSDLRVIRRKDTVLFEIVLKKIRQLSRGHFSRDNQKQLGFVGSEAQIPIYEAKMTGDRRLVYQVDCVQEYGEEYERQVLRIFGVYTHVQINRQHAFWDKVSNQLGRRGAEYRYRCTFRNEPLSAGDNVIQPAVWPRRQDTVKASTIPCLPSSQDDDNAELHSLLVLDKMIPFSQAILTAILADQDIAPVYLLSPEEQKIVYHTSSCYVLGRSGTGKTTTMLFKILGIERAREQHRATSHDVIPKPRQVFVTASQFLASKVAETYSKLARVLLIEHPDADPPAISDVTEQEHALFNMDEESHYDSTLPQRFSQLEDSHFPLFISYNRLCELLQADFKVEQPTYIPVTTAPYADSSRPIVHERPPTSRQTFLSYLVFLRAYWRHFDEPHKRIFDPTQIFSEFMGVIKGSERALQTQTGYLTREEYRKLSRRIGTFFDKREAVYNLFEIYLKLKRRRGEYDAADRTYRVFYGLRKDGIAGRKVDYVYVDEVQDNLLADTFILRSICYNPDGLFWAGDTAQTISAGSSFRFNELKAFQWRLESKSSGARRSDNPELFQLVKNYRSHGGIVKCAQSILELITHFWPDSIDQIEDEIASSIPGLVPMVFTNWGENSSDFERFFFGSSEARIELGAQQCIIVRDDDAKAKLRSQIGAVGIILTIYDSKGLEFDDVLLYNFFQDSTIDVKQWSILLNILPKTPFHCPPFDRTGYGGVCHELKSLYVAITRARHNLWIVDNSAKHEPLLHIWQAKQVVRVHKDGEPLPQLTAKSTSKEWANRGHELMHSEQYEESVLAFRRAGLSRETDVAHAYLLRHNARALPLTSRMNSARLQAFASAARSFSACANVAGADAARKYYRIAAECFVECGDNASAGYSFLSAGDPTRSAQCYRKAGSFDTAVRVITDHRGLIPTAVADPIIAASKMHYLSRHKWRKAISLFPNTEEAAKFMKEYEFDNALAETLTESQRFTEAAELQLSQGHISNAISLFLRDKGNPTSIQRASQTLLDNLWRCVPLTATLSLDRDGLFRSLLECAREFRKEFSKMSQHQQLSLAMFEAIMAAEYAALRTLGEDFHRKYEDKFSALLCLDHYFSRSLSMQDASREQITSTLETFLAYAREMQKLVFDKSASRNDAVQRLFGFKKSADDADTFVAYNESLFNKSAAFAHFPVSPDGVGRVVGASDMPELLKTSISLRLLHMIQIEDQQCHTALAFRPCPLYALFGVCRERTCTRGHVSHEAMDFSWFHHGIRIIMQQIMIVQTISTQGSRTIQLERKSFWLSRLYHSLYPPHRRMGSIAILDHAFIPEVKKAIPIVREWIRDVLHNIHTWVPPHTYLTAIAEMSRLAFTFDEIATKEYLPRTAIVTECPNPVLLRDMQYSCVHDLLNASDGSLQISVSAGILFFSHVCHQKLSIDASALCHILDWICGSIIIGHWIQRGSSMHNVTLPSSWLSKLTPQSTTHSHRNLDLLSLVLEPIPLLLAQIDHASGHLRFEGQELRHASRSVRQMFIFRICQTLSLLGYNMPQYSIRQNIHQALTSPVVNAFGLTRPFARVYSRYVLAQEFQDLVRAMRDSELHRGTPLDDLMQLKDAAKVEAASSVYTPIGTHTLIYKDLSEICALLIERLPKGARPAALFEIPDVPNDEDEDEGDDDTSDEASRPSSPLNEGFSSAHDDIEPVDVDAATSLANDANALQFAAPPTDDEIASAEKIQTIYRYYRWRKSLKWRGLGKDRERWFLECLEVERTSQLSLKPSYRLLFLGALPHLMVCLERALKYTQESKKTAMLRLHRADHSQYEELQAACDRAVRMHKDTRNVLEALKPTSSLHCQSQAKKFLREHVTKAADVMKTLPRHEPVMKECGWDLELAIRVIMTVKKPKNRKPNLGPVTDLNNRCGGDLGLEDGGA